MNPIHYIPILTTVLSALFALSLYRRWRQRGAPHLWWWAFGITTYGAGTAVESLITLFGNTVVLTKVWYVAGAILGGYPLAQGSLYLSWPRRFANRLTVVSLIFVIVSSVLVLLSPVNLAALEPTRPSGAILGWAWVRLLTPFINIYAVFFLIGGAIRSAWRHYFERGHYYRAWGNALIAFGAILPGIGGSFAKAGHVEVLYVALAILPGIGGSFAKAGHVEVLYVAECIGLIVIWIGDRVCSKQDAKAPAATVRPLPEIAES